MMQYFHHIYSVLKAFGNLIKECLCEMENNNFKTIAFPVLGTGNLGYKVEDVANIMITAVGDYNKINPLTCIQNITIYVYSQVAANTKKVILKTFKKFGKKKMILLKSG